MNWQFNLSVPEVGWVRFSALWSAFKQSPGACTLVVSLRLVLLWAVTCQGFLANQLLLRGWVSWLDWLLGSCVVMHKEERLAVASKDWDAL